MSRLPSVFPSARDHEEMFAISNVTFASRVQLRWRWTKNTCNRKCHVCHSCFFSLVAFRWEWTQEVMFKTSSNVTFAPRLRFTNEWHEAVEQWNVIPALRLALTSMGKTSAFNVSSLLTSGRRTLLQGSCHIWNFLVIWNTPLLKQT